MGLVTLLAGCEQSSDSASEQTSNIKTELLAYIGITMAKPMAEIFDIMESRYDIKVTMTQGGSEDLYQSLKSSRLGDLYMPGSASYRERHKKDGLLGAYEDIGFNQASLMVVKGNPKNVRADVNELLRSDLDIVVCNPDSGSIGKESKKILSSVGIYDQVFEKSQYLTTDSRNLNKALRVGDADVILNWRATAFFPENRPNTEILDLPVTMAKPKKLQLNLLTFSDNPEAAKKVMEFAASGEGQAIFRKYGFLDAKGNAEK
ncbi:substrate-binding domain-containing protein [Oceanospirillum sediminis]|uniref:Substrate-binding domain-containing protein n=1 Tax=Oceanospirillum sediminis TaxID=2760088 RepID=A0A839IPY6_9GAMM|nr:substrate-binding domain-containing protein [Oceanospirillum sediminis]MBB1487563.1 substrate-binding domain-containing protein [Oceanospirillum sediminis]